MISVTTMQVRADGTRATELQTKGSLEDIVVDLAFIVRTVYARLSREDHEAGDVLRTSLIDVMTNPDLGFWELEEEPSP